MLINSMITLQLIGFIIIVCRFPKDGRKLRAWKKAINRDNFVPNEYTCICSEHFVSGWHSDDPDDVNYAPTMFSYKLKTFDQERENRLARRSLQKVLKSHHQLNLFLVYTYDEKIRIKAKC